jgi:hypothetical protein
LPSVKKPARIQQAFRQTGGTWRRQAVCSGAFGEVVLRRLVHIVLASGMGFAIAMQGAAQAQTCYTLQAELTHLLGQGAGGGGDRARYDRAYREQAHVLAQTERRARQAGCFGGGFLFFRRQPDRSCGTLLPKLRDMQGNLAKLDRMRRRGGDSGRSSRRVRELQRMIAVRGCGIPGRDDFTAPERIYDPDTRYSLRGTYRTLCVRTCDGYYFPISYSTTRASFGEDAQVCSAMCPGTEAKLFAHRNPGGDPEEMISVDGEPYTSLPTAFKYRTSYDPSCTCRPANGYAASMVDASARPALDPNAARVPRTRPDPSEDPETLANRAGSFTPQRMRRDDPVTASISSDGDERVRTVGPVFGTSPEQEGVVITPVPN